MMDKHDVEFVKRSHNIVDVIGRYVRLKKNGKNHIGLCPFHSEKTPSFTVEEAGQFYHCFGCGANGDVIDFVQQYSGMDFIGAYKELGGELELKPTKEIIDNQKRAAKASKFRFPPDHKDDGEKVRNYLSKCRIDDIGGVQFHRYMTQGRCGFMLPIYTVEGELVNAAIFTDGAPMWFAAGGPSYHGFTPIRMNNTGNWLVCVELADARKIAHELSVNVAVAWDSHVQKYLCKWNKGDLNFKPVIRPQDDDYLCHDMRWCSYSNHKLKNMEMIK